MHGWTCEADPKKGAKKKTWPPWSLPVRDVIPLRVAKPHEADALSAPSPCQNEAKGNKKSPHS